MGVCAVGRRQTGSDQGGGWSRWLTVSGLLHLALLGTLAVLPGVGPATVERQPASLRVRLLTETQEPPVPPPSASATPSTAGASARMRPRQSLPTASRTRLLPLGDTPANSSPEVSAVSPADTAGASPPGMEPLSRHGGGPSRPESGGLSDEGPVRPVFPQAYTDWAPGESGPSPPALPAEGRTQGVLFLPEASGT